MIDITGKIKCKNVMIIRVLPASLTDKGKLWSLGIGAKKSGPGKGRRTLNISINKPYLTALKRIINSFAFAPSSKTLSGVL